MKELENLKELYLDEIKKINKKGELTPTDAEAANKAVEAIKKIEEICVCCDDMDEDYSERYYRSRNRMPEMRRGRGMSYSDGPMYSEAYTMMNNRYPYYRHDGHNGLEVENMIHKLEAMRPEAPDNEIKMAIDNMIRKLEAY